MPTWSENVVTPAKGTDAGDAWSIALVGLHGEITAVNNVWVRFCHANGGDLATSGVGASYLDACDADGDDPAAQRTAQAVRAAIAGELPGPVSIEISCHSSTELRWFDVLVSPRTDDAGAPAGAAVVLIPRSERARPHIERRSSENERASALADALTANHRAVNALTDAGLTLHLLADQLEDASLREQVRLVGQRLDAALQSCRTSQVALITGHTAPNR